jgi:hypothetical protein
MSQNGCNLEYLVLALIYQTSVPSISTRDRSESGPVILSYPTALRLMHLNEDTSEQKETNVAYY